MRNVYCKCGSHDDAKECCGAYFKLLVKRGLKPTQTAGGTVIECNGYRVEFLAEKKFIEYSAIHPASAFLCIPYNRMLMNPRGVKQEECKMAVLTKYITEGVQ